MDGFGFKPHWPKELIGLGAFDDFFLFNPKVESLHTVAATRSGESTVYKTT